MIDNQILQFAGALVVQTACLAFWLGRLSGKVAVNAEDVAGLGRVCRELGDKITDNRKEISSLFIPRKECEGINKQIEIMLSGMRAQRMTEVKQNTKEHLLLLDNVNNLSDKVDKMNECLHKIQNKRDCD